MTTILILGAGLEQKLAIAEAQSLGLRAIACDQDPSAPGLAIADVAIVADITDPAAMAKVGVDHRVAGVFSHGVEIPEVVASVAHELGLPGLPPEVAMRATNKVTRATHLRNHGICGARFSVASSRAMLAKAAAEVGFPLVMKPVDSAGAKGVKIVASPDELPSAYEEALSYSREPEVILEEAMEGPQVSTESVVHDGVIHTFALADRNYEDSATFHPYFVENGINFPSVLPDAILASVNDLVDRTIQCLGIGFGAAKGDIVIHNGEPKIIEMAARTSGGWFGAGSIPLATGANMLKPLIQMAVGMEPDLAALTHTRNLGCAQRYVIPPRVES